ncbi:hypothetical protein CYMTET_4288 [Cymbomonas tetramitiformis]|uniref:Uncharacterized protein n=1 Tax=Cymbomonas tetramitiformis TaxID=36881 RepID=A0AAE0H1I2_9CHLO|nr:hypothetical protein CYMTET_4288 [Cymbomonas tetramitiformis]
MSDKKKQAALPCEVVKRYPGKEQVDLSVQILIPGHWFNGLVGAEKAKKYTATAVEYANCRQFGAARSLVKTEAIRFQVDADVLESPDHEGYWIRLDQWNRFRHDTFKDDRAAELRFIPASNLHSVAPSSDSASPGSASAATRAPVYEYFNPLGDAIHVPQSGNNKGKKLKCSLWKCGLCKAGQADGSGVQSPTPFSCCPPVEQELGVGPRCGDRC